MKTYKKKHYSCDEKIQILRRFIVDVPSRDMTNLAAIIDCYTFVELRNLTKAIAIIAKGK